MQPIKSPIQTKVGSPLFLVKMAADLLRVHKDFLSKVDEFLRETNTLKEASDRIKTLPKGPKGDDGRTPSRGELLSLIKPLIPAPIKGDPGKDAEEVDVVAIAEMAANFIEKPKDGTSPLLENIVAAVMEELKKKDPLEVKKNLEGFKTEMASYRNQLAGKHYGKDTWARGGGDTVKAGVNVTITSDADGNKVINAQGGTGGSTITTQYSLTAVQSGDDVTLDLTQLTNWATFSSLILVMRNNIPQTETLNFTFASPIVTIFQADASEIFNIQYAYS